MVLTNRMFNLGYLADLRLLALVFAVLVFSLLRVVLFLQVYELMVIIIIGAFFNWHSYKISQESFIKGNSKPSSQKNNQVNVCIVGSGFSGICMAVTLKRANVPFTLFEKSGDIGGTWFDNRYPGCACDVWMFRIDTNLPVFVF